MNRKRWTHSPYLTVELAHIGLVRGGRRVLRNLSWRVRPGQHWLLQGANGAGKTQLLKLIAGDVWPQPSRAALRTYRLRGVSSDEPLGVKEHIAYLGAERQDRYEHYLWNHRASTVVGAGIEGSDYPLRRLTEAEGLRVVATMRRLGIAGLAARRFLTLSQGERRLVLLARALVSRPALLLLDEPLNGLDARNRERVLSALGGLRRSSLPWIYATHRAEEAPAGTTHRARLRHGCLQAAAWRPSARVRARAAGNVPAARGAHTAAAGRAQRKPRDLLLELHNASVWREGAAALRAVNWPIRAGECWVVHGANGSGKSTLLATLHGELGVASEGSVWRRGHRPGMPLRDFQLRVGRVSPELQAALPRQQAVLDCVVAGLRGAYRLDEAARAAERRAALSALRRVGAARLARRRFGELSYGQARRVLFARALARRPDIVLLDEPYTGLDAPTRARLRALVDNLATMQHSIVIATHHRDEWPRRATHELELAAGRVRYQGALRRRGRHTRRGR